MVFTPIVQSILNPEFLTEELKGCTHLSVKYANTLAQTLEGRGRCKEIHHDYFVYGFRMRMDFKVDEGSRASFFFIGFPEKMADEFYFMVGHGALNGNSIKSKEICKLSLPPHDVDITEWFTRRIEQGYITWKNQVTLCCGDDGQARNAKCMDFSAVEELTEKENK